MHLAPTPARTLATTAVLALALTACGDPDGEVDRAAPSGPSTTPDAAASSAPPTPSAPVSAQPPAIELDTDRPGMRPALDSQCTLEPDAGDVPRVRYAVPAEWRADGRCDVLDPEVDDLPEDQGVEAAVFVDVVRGSFDRLTAGDEATRDRVVHLGARADRRTARIAAVTTGVGLHEAGRPVLSWYVDLGGTGDGARTLVMSTGVGEEEFATAATMLDRVAGSVVTEPAADLAIGDGAYAVLRTVRDAVPTSVTYDGACFALHVDTDADPTATSCDVDPTTGPVATTMLGDGVLVGHAPGGTVAVEPVDGVAPFGLATSIEGGAVFAVPVTSEPERLRLLAPGGAELATVPVR